MKKIVLKSLELVNFKGVRQIAVAFSENGSIVSGENGTGKTTLFDAFLWLLFGKDSSGRSDGNGGFNVKTLDDAGKPIYHLEHSVTAVLDVNGKEIKLQRALVEKWRKVNGTTDETMKDETQYFINDVKCGTRTEYQLEIAEIIPEEHFKMITNPFYFNKLSADVQKEMLYEMVGYITDADVAALNPEYMELIKDISGDELVKYAKEVSMKKRAINELLATIPASIQTAEKLMPEAENWDELEAELKEKQSHLKDIDRQLADKSQQNAVENERKVGLQKQVGELKLQLAQRENTIRFDASAGYNAAVNKVKELQYQLDNCTRTKERITPEVERINERLQQQSALVEGLRNQFRAISKESYVAPVDTTSLICPLCHEPLKGGNLEAKLAELKGNWEQNKTNRLKQVQNEGVREGEKEKSLKKQLADVEQQISANDDEILRLSGELEIAKNSIPQALNADALIAKDAKCIDLHNQIEQVQNELTIDAPIADLSELNEGKDIFTQSILDLTKRLEKRTQIKRIQDEIKELEDKRIQNNQALADLERWENIYTSFCKDKDKQLEERINGLFSMVKFSFVKEQKNGGEKITCFCSVNGTPYPDVNTAGKINAGLDIINAICRNKGISAPIFIDNRESVNTIIPTISQVINLCVTHDKTLKIQ